MQVLPKFYGDLAWIHAKEDYRGAPSVYWPGGQSGVTLRPGVDLGYADWSLVRSVYGELIKPAEDAVRGARHLKGSAAKAYLDRTPELKQIKIPYAEGHRLFALAARPYWEDILRRFPGLDAFSVPNEVHTAMLSLAFNRGAGNPALRPLGKMIDDQDWSGVAAAVGAMQQNHRLRGIRKRRRQEAALIAGAAEREEAKWVRAVSTQEALDEANRVRSEALRRRAEEALSRSKSALADTVRKYTRNLKPL